MFPPTYPLCFPSCTHISPLCMHTSSHPIYPQYKFHITPSTAHSCSFMLSDRCILSNNKPTLYWAGCTFTSKLPPTYCASGISEVEVLITSWLNLRSPDIGLLYYTHLLIPGTSIWHIFFIKIHAFFPDKRLKNAKKLSTLSLNVKESENIILGSIPLSGYAPKVSGFYSGPKHILHPSFREIRWVFFC